MPGSPGARPSGRSKFCSASCAGAYRAEPPHSGHGGRCLRPSRRYGPAAGPQPKTAPPLSRCTPPLRRRARPGWSGRSRPAAASTRERLRRWYIARVQPRRSNRSRKTLFRQSRCVARLCTIGDEMAGPASAALCSTCCSSSAWQCPAAKRIKGPPTAASRGIGARDFAGSR